MKKIINISGKDYTMQSSAYTQFAYKDLTGRSLLNDLQEISYVMIQEADSSQVNDYVSFLKSIDDLYTDPNWIEEVILLACTPISGRLQGNK